MHSFWQTALSAAILGNVATAAVAPLEKRQLLAPPKAVIKNGTVIGSTDYLNNVDNFNGIPYAVQPTGTLRLTNPTPVQKAFGTFTATGTPTACYGLTQTSPTPTGLSAQIQQAQNESPLFKASSTTGENCLNLNVQRTAGIKPGQKVPVLVWIYGGGFELGSTQMYDATNIIKKANSLGKPLVYVAMNYRLAGLGFLPGKEMAGLANLGLKDQRLALKWVQDNIEAFGGDPAKVTIWGESAGSISVFDQLIAEGGDINYNGKPLFHGAIMNSGSAVPALDISTPIAQAVYDQVVQNTNCTGAPDTLTCLRSVPDYIFVNAMSTLPGIFAYQSLHLAFFPRPDPSDNFYPTSPENVAAGGKFAKVPVIIGDMEDEGTLFAQVQNNITTTADLIGYLNTYFPEGDPNDVVKLVNSYPDDQAAGSPFRTGTNNNQYPQYKRLAAILGDIVFTLIRRAVLSYTVPQGIKAWTYLNTYLYGSSALGTFHGADIVNNYNLALSSSAQNATQTYYISFVYYQDPNVITPAVYWPTWTDSDRNLLNFTSDKVQLGKDDFRENQYQTLLSVSGKIQA